MTVYDRSFGGLFSPLHQDVLLKGFASLIGSAIAEGRAVYELDIEQCQCHAFWCQLVQYKQN